MFKNVDVYSKPHGTGNGESSGGAGTVIIQTGNINQVPNELNINSITANRADFDHLKADAASINDANIIYLMSSDGIINKLSGNELNYEDGYIKNLTSDQIETNKLKVKDTAYITNLISDYIQSNSITTDYLTVNKSAHFFELVIDKIRSVQGTQINTAANCVIDYVEAYKSNNELTYIGSSETDHYRVYWKNTDGSGHAINNDWITNDQAICETFNVVSGTTSNADNKYYWRLVTNSSSEHEPRHINLNEDYTGSDKISYDPISYYTVSFNDDFSFLATGENSDTYDINSYTFTYYNIKDQYTNSVLEAEDDIIEWRVRNVNQGIQLIPMDYNMSYTFPISKGTFSFSTYEPTNLNIGVYYDDNTFEYFPADGFKTDYSVDTKQDTAAAIEAFVITSDSVEEWSACNWIDLSDTVKDVSANVNDIPERGDNLAQLGYRYGQNATDEEKQRGSAIIIAAYRTPDPDVKCPTFSQYQNINDFSLSTHRGTWIDRTGCYIKGNLVSESGDIINIDDELNINTESYRLIPGENPIVKPASRTKTIVFDVLHILNGSGEILTYSDLSSWYITVQGNGVSVVSGFDVEVNTSATQMKVSLYDSNDVLKDTFTATLIDLADVSDGENGKNGDYHQWIYKNAISRPNTPAWASPCPPSGWSETASSPGANSYTWMSQRLMSYTASNDLIFGYWSTPARISGADGEQGADGNSIEFIYHRYDKLLTNSDLQDNTYNPHLWDEVQEDDYTGPSVYGWTDNPQGITEVYSYEYISTREKTNGSWSYFDEPKLWSKWGEKGQDGDGVKYVFTNSLTALQQPKFTGGSWPNESVQRQDIKNNKLWYDEPTSPSSAYGNVFCSQSSYSYTINGTKFWSEFSNPSIWALYVTNGETGATGPQGPQGEDGTSNKLAPEVETWEVRTSSTSDYNSIQSTAYTFLRYKVLEVEGKQVTNVSNLLSGGYGICAYVKAATQRNGNSRIIASFNAENHTTYFSNSGFTEKDNNSTFELKLDNMLSTIYSSLSSTYKDYHKLQLSSDANAYLPIEMLIELYKNNVVQDRRILNISFKAGHVFEVTDAALNSAFFGTWTNSYGQTYNGLSHLYQDMQGIQTNVSSLSTSYNTLYNDYSQFKQTSSQFQTTVTQNINYSGDGHPNLFNGTFFKSEEYILANGWNKSINGSAFISDGAGICNNQPSIRMCAPTSSTNHVSLYQTIPSSELGSNICFSVWVRNRISSGNRYIGLGVYDSPYSGNYIYNYIKYKGTETGISSVTAPSSNTSSNQSFPQWRFTDQNWHRIYVTFTKPNYSNIQFIIRTWGNSDFDVSSPKLECYTSLQEPTPWIPGLDWDDTVKSSQVTQTANEIKAEIKNGLSSTGIDITNNLITLNSQNTVINGDLGLRGNFTSENQTTKNKIVIDAYSGGLNMYGPKQVNDDNWNLPQSDSTPQGKLFGLNYGVDADSLSRIGILEVGNAADSSQYVSIDGGTSTGGGIEIADNYHKIYLSTSGIGFNSRWNTSDNWGTAESDYASWGELLASSLSISGEVNYSRTIPNQNIVICNPTSAAISLTLENPNNTEPLAQHIIVNKGTKSVSISSPNSNYQIIRNGLTSNINLGAKHTYTLLWIGDGWAVSSFV